MMEWLPILSKGLKKTLGWGLTLLIVGGLSWVCDGQGIDDKLDFKKRTDKAAFKDLNNEDTTNFKYGMTSSLTINQNRVENWQAGGINNFGGNAVLGAYMDYRSGRHYWLTLLDASYGLNKNQGQPAQKIQDYLELNTKYGYAYNNFWSLTAFAEGISQFSNSYDYKVDPQGTIPISRFMAPGFFNEGVGLVYEEKTLGLYSRFAPFTARQIVVLDDGIDERRFGLDSGSRVKNQFGASFRADYLKTLVDKPKFKLTAESRLSLFADYVDPLSMVTNWRNKLSVNVAKVFTFSVLVHLIYDPNVRFVTESTTDPVTGVVTPTRQQQKIQLLQNFGFGVGYTFSSVKRN